MCPWKSRSQIWDPILARDLGADMDQKFGSNFGLSLGPNFGPPQKWTTHLGPTLGVPNRGQFGDQGAPHMPRSWAPNCTKFGTPNIRAKFGTQTKITQNWSQIRNPNLGSTSGPTHGPKIGPQIRAPLFPVAQNMGLVLLGASLGPLGDPLASYPFGLNPHCGLSRGHAACENLVRRFCLRRWFNVGSDSADCRASCA